VFVAVDLGAILWSLIVQHLKRTRSEGPHMTEPNPTFRAARTVRSVKLGIVAGFVACFAYPLAVFAHPPKLVTVALIACFGPALAIGCYGLRQLLDCEGAKISTSIGLLLNALGGALFCVMAFVQLAVVYSTGAEKVPSSIVSIWLGLDVACDAYIGMGTVCFALAMLRHPRFGLLFCLLGVAIGAGLLALHLWSFPTPPQSAGPVDLGPALGLWYFVVMIQMWHSIPWLRQHA